MTPTEATTADRIDRDEIIRTVTLLSAVQRGGTTEVRALDATVNGDRRPLTYSGYFDNADDLAAEVATIKSATGIYFIPNDVDPRLLARAKNRIRPSGKGNPATADKDITNRRFLLIDCDATRPAAISTSDEEHEAALARARIMHADTFEWGWPDGVIADSGNGAHLVFSIDGVETLADDELIKRCLESLHAEFGDDAVKVDQSVFNPARIWKLYGTLACKGDDTPDRPHRMARILHLPEEFGMARVTRQQLEALAAKAPAKPAAATNGHHVGNGQAGQYDLEGFIARNLEVLKVKPYDGGQLWEIVCPFNPEHNSGEAFVIRRGDGKLQAGCHHESCQQWIWDDLRARFDPKQERQPNRNSDNRSGYQKPANESQHAGIEPRRFRVYTSRELDEATFTIAFWIAWTLVAGQPCIFAGSKKTLKTTLLIALAIALVAKQSFLGQIEVLQKCRVLIMSGESGIGVLQETARRIATAMNCRFADLEDDLLWSDELPQFAHLADLDGLDLLLQERKVDVLIIDPAFLCMSGEGAENLFKQGATLRAFNEVCQRNGVTLIIAHHLKRGVADPFRPPELEDIAWAGFQEWCRQWILVGRRERYEPGTGQHRLWLNVGGSVGHSALWALDIDEGKLPNRKWEVSVMHADEARNDVEERREEARSAAAVAKVEKAKEKIIKALVKYPNGETAKVIREAAGLNGGQATRDAFAELAAAGDIAVCEIQKGKKGKPENGFKLADRPD